MDAARVPLISVKGLTKHFPVSLGAFGEQKATVYAVDGMDFDVFSGETLGFVGESGCGKSTVGYCLLQLQEPTSGKILYNGVDITGFSERKLRPYRKNMQIVFQDPYSTLNPRMTVGDAIAEPIRIHKTAKKSEIMNRVAKLLADVGIDPKCQSRYPHEFSGGQRQRICIARALACEPQFIVCDEAISALDVSIQAQILNLLQDLQEKYNLTYLFIAHDLAVVRHVSTRVAVVYLGKIVEIGDTEQIYQHSLHPYTKALLNAVPVADPILERNRDVQILCDDLPSPINPPSGCHFHTRCAYATEECKIKEPKMDSVGENHWVACHHTSG